MTIEPMSLVYETPHPRPKPQANGSGNCVEQADLELSGPEVRQIAGKVKEKAERHLSEKGSQRQP